MTITADIFAKGSRGVNAHMIGADLVRIAMSIGSAFNSNALIIDAGVFFRAIRVNGAFLGSSQKGNCNNIILIIIAFFKTRDLNHKEHCAYDRYEYGESGIHI